MIRCFFFLFSNISVSYVYSALPLLKLYGLILKTLLLVLFANQWLVTVSLELWPMKLVVLMTSAVLSLEILLLFVKQKLFVALVCCAFEVREVC